MKRESYESSFMVPGVMMNQTPYWPVELVSPTQDHPPLLEDQAAITNLLIKLGGRFSENHQQQPNITTTGTNFQYPIDIISSPQDQLYANSMSMLTSSTATNSIGSASTCSQLPNMFLQGLENFASEFFEFGYDNNPQQQQLNGLEVFYGMNNMVNGSTGTNTPSSGESASWGDITSLVVPPPLVSEYEACQQDSTFGDFRYFRPPQ
jgi:myb proto-oncogene protein